MKRAFPVMVVLFCCMIFCMTGCGSSEKSDSGAKEEKTVKFCSLLMYMGNSIQ